MPSTSVAPSPEGYQDPHLNGGRNPKDAPKPAGHYRVNVGLVVALVIALPLFFLLTACTPHSTPKAVAGFSKYSLSHTASKGATKSPFDTFQDMSGTYSHLRAAAQEHKLTECRRSIEAYNNDYMALQKSGVTAVHLKDITAAEGIPNGQLGAGDCVTVP